jgi:hypothetical protein
MAGGNWMDRMESNEFESDMLGIHHNEGRVAFQCISGWTLMLWQNQHQFQAGIHGARRAPRPLCWFDLRKANDVHVNYGDPDVDDMPHTITIAMSDGNYFFSVSYHEEVNAWWTAIRSLIQDAAIMGVRLVDTPAHQRKRWIAACGSIRALLDGGPLGTRALAVLFHAYDVDYNCRLRIGEIMLLIQEMTAAMPAVAGLAEGEDRETAMQSARSHCPEDQLFERAAVFRRRCDEAGSGEVTKDAFLLRGLEALREALDLGGGPPAQPPAEFWFWS